MQLSESTVFHDLYTSPVYVTDGSNAPSVLLPESYQPSYLTIDDTLFAKVGADFYQVDHDLTSTIIYDAAANTTGVDLGSADYYFEFQGDLWVRGDGSSGLANDFYRYDVSAGTWSEMNIAENSGGDSLYFSFNMVGDSQFFGWISTVDGLELHVSDGTAGDWAQVADIRPGSTGSYVDASDSGMIGDTLIFVADDGGVDDAQLWASDGTAPGTFAISGTGTQMVANFSPDDYDSNTTLGFMDFVTLQVENIPVNKQTGTSDTEEMIGIGLRDLMFGLGGMDTLAGLDGADTLKAGAGMDTLYGGRGHDKLEGGKGHDHAEGAKGDDRIFGNKGADTLKGGKGDDRLVGGKGHDRLIGQKGADTLDGGIGDDFLVGGGGRDDFIFKDGYGDDTIKCFDALSNGEDIDLSAVSAISDFADLSANHMQQIGDHVVIDGGADLTITLLYVALGDLGAGDFIF